MTKGTRGVLREVKKHTQLIPTQQVKKNTQLIPTQHVKRTTYSDPQT